LGTAVLAAVVAWTAVVQTAAAPAVASVVVVVAVAAVSVTVLIAGSMVAAEYIAQHSVAGLMRRAWVELEELKYP